MNLEAFTDDTPESEFHRVVRHETGHTLGFPHEHMRRALVAKIDPDKAIEYFGRTQGWSPDEVRAQVLTPIEESTLIGGRDIGKSDRNNDKRVAPAPPPCRSRLSRRISGARAPAAESRAAGDERQPK